MIENIINTIIQEDFLLNYVKEEIENYLREVKMLVADKKYYVAKRKNNDLLFVNYLIDEAMVKSILMSLNIYDFCKIVDNEHLDYPDEKLYIFSKKINLDYRYIECSKDVSLYIKLNKIDDKYCVVVSFHEQEYPLKTYFI